jgi:hypothetical protein
MIETPNHGAPGRSLLAEMTELREQMSNLRVAMLQLVELQCEANTKLDVALKGNTINGDAAMCPTSPTSLPL